MQALISALLPLCCDADFEARTKKEAQAISEHHQVSKDRHKLVSTKPGKRKRDADDDDAGYGADGLSWEAVLQCMQVRFEVSLICQPCFVRCGTATHCCRSGMCAFP